jgi:porphobilinogen synthase
LSNHVSPARSLYAAQKTESQHPGQLLLQSNAELKLSACQTYFRRLQFGAPFERTIGRFAKLKNTLMAFPTQRPRRLRHSEALRTLVRETMLSASQFILPLFVCSGENVRKEISSMPGHAQLSIDLLVKEAEQCHRLGLGGVILFGIPQEKDEYASGAYASDGITQRAVRALKKEVPGLLVITDVCNCEYTSHGHCGFVANGDVDNDKTLEWLAKTAVSHAVAGADVVAPSDMMDGRVAAIRRGLDTAGHSATPILSYAAKYASAFYGPFREAAESTPQFGDRRTYQMDPGNAREALREIALDIDEGADMIMVKPAMAYLDIIHAARQAFDLPIGAYQVSGEFSMIMAAGQNGWLDLDRTILESLIGIRRAGADFILTYFAKEGVRLLS